MKHTTRGLLWVCLIALLLAGCERSPDSGKSSKESFDLPELTLNDEPESFGDEPRVTIVQIPPPGSYRVTATNHSEHWAQGQGQYLKKEKDNWYDVTVSAPDEHGNTAIATTLTRSVYRRSDRNIDIDTDKPESLKGSPQKNLLAAMLNSPITYVMDSKGNLVGTEGLDKIRAELEKMAVDTTRPFLNQMMGALEKADFRTLVNPATGFAPPGPVGLNAVWHPEFTMAEGSDYETTVKAKCKLTRFIQKDGRPVAVVEFQAIAETKPIQVPVADLFIKSTNIRSHKKGEFVIDRETGICLEMTSHATNVGDVMVLGKKLRNKVSREKTTTIRPVGQ